MPSYSPVIALARGLEVLRAVNKLRRATVGSIHRETGINKPTIVRMLETLEHEGYLGRDAQQAVYVPTGRTLLLTQGYDLHERVTALSSPLLAALEQDTGWPSDIGLRDGDAMIIVQNNRQNEPVLFSRRPGFRAPMLVSSVGRAYLAFCPQSERQEIIERLQRESSPWRDLARNAKWLDEILEETRTRGFATTDETYSEQELNGALWAMAVPVLGTGRVLASLNLLMMRSVASYDTAVSDYLAPLQRAAGRLRSIFPQPALGTSEPQAIPSSAEASAPAPAAASERPDGQSRHRGRG